MRLLFAVLTLFAVPIAATAQNDSGSRPGRVVVPFDVGEQLVYDAKFGAIKVGTARMTVSELATIRGREAWHTSFRVSGGTFFYKLDDKYESWFDTRTFGSLRHVQDVDQGSYERTRTFEIFPDRRVYTENDSEERESVAEPLDDGSFLYFIRTIPFSVGQTYNFHRYFRPDRNPVTIHVLRKERVKVPAGTFDCVVIRPIIKSRGIFSEGGKAELWISDDDRRIMVQMKSQLKIGSLNLYLRSYTPGNGQASGS
ncbi:MAG TPA: DUF3108 domain-containing protein [Gemmatimonadaceae bacterium]|nr:DUF3108 domain-containing protein [Gemmatimonadaceae bacterium]